MAARCIRAVGQAQITLRWPSARQFRILADARGAVRLNGPVDDVSATFQGNHFDHRDFRAGSACCRPCHHPGGLERQQASLLNLDARIVAMSAWMVALFRRSSCRRPRAAQRAGTSASSARSAHADQPHAVEEMRPGTEQPCAILKPRRSPSNACSRPARAFSSSPRHGRAARDRSRRRRACAQS